MESPLQNDTGVVSPPLRFLKGFDEAQHTFEVFRRAPAAAEPGNQVLVSHRFSETC